MKCECPECKGEGYVEDAIAGQLPVLVFCPHCYGLGYTEEYEHEDKLERQRR